MLIDAPGLKDTSAPRSHPDTSATALLLDRSDFRRAVAMLPLVSIDLLVRNPDGDYLLGLRANPPACSSWFVPGGRIRKNETLRAALERLSREELGLAQPPCLWRQRGVYEHFYDTNFAGEPGCSTHYVVLAYETTLSGTNLAFPKSQHRRYRWSAPRAMQGDSQVHPYTKAYFRESGP